MKANAAQAGAAAGARPSGRAAWLREVSKEERRSGPVGTRTWRQLVFYS